MQVHRKIKSLQWLFAFLLIGSALYFVSNSYWYKTKPPEQKHSKAELLAEINGHMAWKAEKEINPAHDLEAFIRGVRACAENAAPPNNLSWMEMYDLVKETEYEFHQKNILKNLEKSEEFLLEVSKKPQIITLTEKELYYELLSEGSGPAIVEPSATYLFHYTVSSPEKGDIFDTRTPPRAQKICLDYVIPGFAQGVLGMKVGERRKLYIHPKLGYRCMHWTLPPNTALIIDVELIGREDDTELQS